ncbi:MAG: zinc ribbon domain-containing protein [Ruminococcaceae bacterium]|nr:zinc ribbon domain-containing protein [Oscillospiraceae bacterium]
MYCRYCGTDIGDKDAFCVNCGKATGVENENNSTSKVYTDSSIDPVEEQLVGTKQEYYIPRFLGFKYQGKKVSWNWCSFLFPVNWMVYRKMYAVAAVWWIAVFMLNVITEFSFGLLSGIASGLFGNYIYMMHIQKLAQQANVMDETSRQNFIHRKGGTNRLAVILLILLQVIMWVLLFTLIFAYAYTIGDYLW